MEHKDNGSDAGNGIIDPLRRVGALEADEEEEGDDQQQMEQGQHKVRIHSIRGPASLRNCDAAAPKIMD